jgi:hypothetical protein
MRRVMVMGAVSLVVVLAAQAALATEITDPKDTGGKIDIESVDATRVGQQGHILEVAVTMYGTWPSSVLNSSGKNRIQIIFDTNSDGIPDYVGSIADANGHLRMIVRGHGSTFEPIKVTRPDDNTALFHIPGSSPPNPVHKYRVAAKSVFFPNSGPKKVDRAPDHGWIAVPHA